MLGSLAHRFCLRTGAQCALPQSLCKVATRSLASAPKPVHKLSSYSIRSFSGLSEPAPESSDLSSSSSSASTHSSSTSTDITSDISHELFISTLIKVLGPDGANRFAQNYKSFRSSPEVEKPFTQTAFYKQLHHDLNKDHPEIIVYMRENWSKLPATAIKDALAKLRRSEKQIKNSKTHQTANEYQLVCSNLSAGLQTLQDLSYFAVDEMSSDQAMEVLETLKQYRRSATPDIASEYASSDPSSTLGRLKPMTRASALRKIKSILINPSSFLMGIMTAFLDHPAEAERIFWKTINSSPDNGIQPYVASFQDELLSAASSDSLASSQALPPSASLKHEATTTVIDYQAASEKLRELKQQYKIFLPSLPVSMRARQLMKQFRHCGPVVAVEMFRDFLKQDVQPPAETLPATPKRRKERVLRAEVRNVNVSAFVYFVDEASYKRAIQPDLQLFGLNARGHQIRTEAANAKTSLFVRGISRSAPLKAIHSQVEQWLRPLDVVFSLSLAHDTTIVVITLPNHGLACDAYSLLHQKLIVKSEGPRFARIGWWTKPIVGSPKKHKPARRIGTLKAHERALRDQAPPAEIAEGELEQLESQDEEAIEAASSLAWMKMLTGEADVRLDQEAGASSDPWLEDLDDMDSNSMQR